MIFKTVKECQDTIKAILAIGLQPDPNWYVQLAALQAAASSATPASAPSHPIYAYLKSTQDEYGRPKYSADLQKCIEKTVDSLLNPAPGFSKKDPGLLLGKIQSGKTRAFIGIIGLLFDKGIDIAVVLTKGTKALAQQTLTRMEDEFSAFASRQFKGQAVIEVSDILNKRSGFSVRELKNKNIIICKKEKNNLDILNKIAHINGFDQKRILIVDDEADFASRNYKNIAGTTDLAAIATSIDSLVASLQDCYYLQVTATPYSLYLQPDGCLNLSGRGQAMPFKPRFTCLLPIYPEYVGGQQYFSDSLNTNSMYSHLFRAVREQCREAISRIDKRYINNVTTSPSLVELRQAVMGYFMATAIRRIQENNRVDYLSSCIVHVEIAKSKHIWEGELIIELAQKWEDDIRNNNGVMPPLLTHMLDILYDDYKDSISKGLNNSELPSSIVIPPKPDVLVEIASLFLSKDYRIEVINSDQDVKALLDRNGQLKLTHAVNIFVGGQILDRGITISNLLCFFYGRNPRKLQQDTVLQHSRMYGNRAKEDMAVTRFYTTVRLYTLLSEIDELDEQLRQWLIQYSTTQGFDPAMAVVFSDSQNLKPCSSGKIAMSECVALRAGRRMVHSGFQTDSQTAIKPIIDNIDRIITSQPNYSNMDSDGIFEVDANVIIDLLHQVRSTYIYNRPIDNNADLDWNVQEMIGAIQYATTNTNGKMWMMHKTNRNLSRVRQNGCFSDAPDDGRTDLAPARAKSVNLPIIMFIKENGLKSDGWRDAPFYWPVLVLQQNLRTAFYTSSQSAQ